MMWFSRVCPETDSEVDSKTDPKTGPEIQDLRVADAVTAPAYRNMAQAAVPVEVGAQDQVVLASGDKPLVIQRALGSGQIVVFTQPLSDEFWYHGATPLWAVRLVRAATLLQPSIIQQGDPVPVGIWERAGERVAVDADVQQAPPLLFPGVWQRVDAAPTGGNAAGSSATVSDAVRALYVLAQPEEWRLGAPVRNDLATTLSDALPQERGTDWGQVLLLMAAMMIVFEGWAAAQAGRAYGR